MQIRRAHATFGKLQSQTLELREGLNIIQAPNEAGKSTWCAFLLAMFYGINSRERDKAGFIADKKRYQPWNGSAMSGRLELTADGQEITLTRATKRATAPMGEFQAVYTGTATPVASLNAAACGETLLGVGREVFERSCFIRQSGLSITQDAELERRIAALITTGEEDTSYIEAYEALKKQLNRRQHYKTGQIPALEAELAELQRQLDHAGELQRQLLQLRSQTEGLTARKQALEEELEQHRLWELSLQQKQRAMALSAAQRAEEQALALEQQLEAAQVPDSGGILRLQSAMSSLEELSAAVSREEDALCHAKELLADAELDAAGSPHTGQSEEALRNAPLRLPPKPKYHVILMIAAGILAGLVSRFLLPSQPVLPIGIGAGAALVTATIDGLLLRRRRADWETLRVKAEERRAEEVAAYHDLTERLRAARAEADARANSAASLKSTYTKQEAHLLAQIRVFAPTVYDRATAEEALAQALQQRKTQAEAAQAAQRARIRYEAIAQQGSGDGEVPAEAVQPARAKEAVVSELNSVAAQLSAAGSTADHLSGQLHMIGDPAEIDAEAQRHRQQLTQLRSEYDAIRLAMETLERANTTLQNRFSPQLGRRAAEIFRRLSGNRYQSVAMDRSFRLSARPEDDSIDRSIQLLSAGAADQLYLATRLAICDLVLPEDKAVPIILDDALANFDDARCAAALDYLKELSATRQVILFSCHSREAEYFAENVQVSVQRLTNAH